jgi:hypothetical protein
MAPPNRAGGPVVRAEAGVGLDADTVPGDAVACPDGGWLLHAAKRFATGMMRAAQ